MLDGEGDGVVDIASALLPRANLARRRLDRASLSGDGAHEVDVMAPPLEQVAAASGAVEEPRP